MAQSHPLVDISALRAAVPGDGDVLLVPAGIDLETIVVHLCRFVRYQHDFERHITSTNKTLINAPAGNRNLPRFVLLDL